MRIAHVVTYLTATGAFGGPTSVAAGHCRELHERGHDVVLYAGWDGVGAGQVAGVRTRSYRARRILPSGSFSLLMSLPLLLRFARDVRRFDVVHVHLARDLVTLPVATLCLLAGTPLVVQTHGMIIPDRRLLCRVLDAVAVRTVLRRARRHLVLTDLEREQVLAVAPGRANVERIGNGVATVAGLRASWPPAGELPEVIFCSRLHPRKRVPAFVEMAAVLLEQGVRARFSIVGPDGGELDTVTRLIAERGVEQAVHYEGSLPAAQIPTRLAGAQVFVLPSVDEPFPMAALEAMSVGLPVVITGSNGIADVVRGADDRFVSTPDHRDLADRVRALLADEPAWQRGAAASTALVAEHFGLAAVIERLVDSYIAARG